MLKKLIPHIANLTSLIEFRSKRNLMLKDFIPLSANIIDLLTSLLELDSFMIQWGESSVTVDGPNVVISLRPTHISISRQQLIQLLDELKPL
jgi:hypothetical protein